MKNKLIVVALLSWLGWFNLQFTASAQPVVTTLAASGVARTNATLNGTVNPNGAATTAYFQYGLTTNYGSFSATNILTAGNATLPVSNLISSLSPGTTYHYRIVGVNGFGSELGANLTFTTAQVPIAVTTEASGVTATNATLNGTLQTGGLNTTVYFRYGLTTNYGSFSGTNILAGTNTALSVSNVIGGLSANTTYHFQLVATNSAGTGQGGNLTFTTLPSVTTAPATSLTATSATLNGTVKPGNGTTTLYFQYGLTTNYGSFSATNSVASTNATLAVSNVVSGLAPGTTYHFQLVGTNSTGTALGGNLTFTTSTGAPRATTLAATNVTVTNAALRGTVTTGGLTTSAYFRYGLTTNYGSFTATNSLAGTNTTLSVSNLIGSLIQGSTYHFQLVATNSAGTALGGNLTFTTPALPPVVTTLPATSITPTNATLNGTVNPKGGVTTAYFQYGLTTNYGYLGGFSTLPPETNTTLTLPGFASTLPGAAGANWTLSSAPGDRNWIAITCSADGTRLVAVSWPSLYSTSVISTSTDSGATWTLVASIAYLSSIASSADGMRLAAASAQYGVLTSTDGGATWTQTSYPTEAFTATSRPIVASSADGTRLVAAVWGDRIRTSSDGGLTWTQSDAPAVGWKSLASSADGTRLTAGSYGDGIWTSADAGRTWSKTSAPSNATEWKSIASSADGMRLVAGGNNGVVTSSDGGLTWTPFSLGTASWGVASSLDGLRLAAVKAVGSSSGHIYTSTDGGVTWNFSGGVGETLNVVASSGDGKLLATVAWPGGIYTSTGASEPLLPGTTYHYRLVGANSAGTGLGSNLTFTTSPVAPLVSTLAANGIAMTSATLNGAVNPNGAAATAYFRYGLTTNYGSFSATNSLPATNVTLSVSNVISSLAAATTYYYQLVSSNSVGTSLGVNRTFTTAAVATLAASGITATNATLNGSVNPNGAATAAYFQYGLTTNYGSFSATNSLAAGNTTLAVSNLISSLAPGTLYHFRIVATNSGGTFLGSDLIFTTSAGVPTVATLAASGVTAASASLNAAINTGGFNTAAYFQYGLTTNYGSFSSTNNLAATNTPQSLSSLIGSLAPATTYHFRAVGINSVGTALGANLTFITATGAPTATTLAASGVTQTNATLNGTVKTGGLTTTAYFEYGLTTNYGGLGGVTYLPPTNDAALPLGFLVSGPKDAAGANWTPSSAPSTNYWQSIASSADGTRLAAVVYGGGIYASTNSGATWNLTAAPVADWRSIASSADGLRLVGADSSGGIHSSTNGGGTWTQTSAPILGWLSVSSSADGSRLAAGSGWWGIYRSANGGATWVKSDAPSTDPYGNDIEWSGLASSADGTRLAACYPAYGSAPGRIYRSADSGLTWTLTTATNARWQSIAASADGTRLAAAASFEGSILVPTNFGGIWTSTNSGNTWTLTGADRTARWRSIAASADGTRLAAVAYGGGIHTSTNSGLTWTQSDAPGANWQSIAGSADGTQLAAAIVFGGIYTSTGASEPLLPGTTYHYRLVGANSAGTGLGSNLTFTTLMVPPTVNTLAATGITATNAVLNGTINPANAATTAYFQYGLTTNYGSFSATNTLAAGSSTLSESNLITSLVPGTVYHYRLVGSNSAGTALGGDLSFTTPALPPVVTAAPATGITATNATLNGSVNPGGGITTAYFRYGLTTSYGSNSATNSLAATNRTLSVSNLIGGLVPGTTYHYQLVAANSAGTTLGGNLSFTAPALPPAVTSLPATGITATSATLNASVNPNGATTTAYFRYGLTTNYGSYGEPSQLPAGNTTLSVSNLIGGLVPGTIYHCQLVAINSGGTVAGANLTFTTSAGVPTVVTLAASGVSATGVTLNGAVNPGGAATTAYFRYGLTTNYGSFSATNSLAATNAALAVSSLLGGLAPGTTYHFQLVGVSSAGSSVGGNQTFTTDAGPPVVTTLAASGITATNGTLNGTVNPNGAATAAYFQYGLTTNYGSFTVPSLLSATNAALSVANLISGLAPGTLYHCQLVGINSAATVLGADVAFTTAAGAPTATTLAASGVVATNATLNGTVTTGGLETTAYFRYGLTTNYGSFSAAKSLAPTNTPQAVPDLIGNLAPGTTYHYQLVGSNSSGTSAGADLMFTTVSAQPVAFYLYGSFLSPGGAFQLRFANLSGLGFTVLGTTNVALPLSNWTVLGAPTEAPAGQYQFTDSQTTNNPRRFYRVRSP